MGSAQDEIRRLMKEAKRKPGSGAAARAKVPSTKPKPPAKPSSAAASSSSQPPQQSAVPAGFFDDSLADAKARNVDVQQLAQKQLESDWEAFQEFAAEVEQQSAQEGQAQAEEAKEREAEEQLDNMQYVDRYRLALERATSLRNAEKKEKRKLHEAADDSVADGGEAEGASAIETAVSEYKRKHKKAKKQQRQSDSDDSDDFDPCNWRSRGM
ncbi:zinc finger protein 830 [Phytophthora cinnamomi]|uniref:zinc finger protein 830 n=1 Tax=Phytophthora cinnamomi TaxID=4785 RepID=UPI00355A2FEC|nr:zinc finger protein 830 [Phytophthora cinnamomi]